jgi:ankyrin repeat protein
MACKNGNENLVKYLVKIGVDVKKLNKYGETPLFDACYSGNVNLVKYLVENGVDINKKKIDGIKPHYLWHVRKEMKK